MNQKDDRPARKRKLINRNKITIGFYLIFFKFYSEIVQIKKICKTCQIFTVLCQTRDIQLFSKKPQGKKNF